MKRKARLAILDMNNRAPNEGLRCIKDIVSDFEDQLYWSVFDVRGETKVPDLSYDIYIWSGGPGSPLETGTWRDLSMRLLDDAWQHNQLNSASKKHMFFICYSFQLACEHFGLSEITKRRSTSFGVYPIHKTKVGRTDPILTGLQDPYFAVDSRDWQVVQPRLEVFKEHGAEILSIERLRTHVEYERAVMSVRFSDEFVGTQFHPEADPEGMKVYFLKPENREKVIRNFDEATYENMMRHIDDPDKIRLTHETILPGFIKNALSQLFTVEVPQ